MTKKCKMKHHYSIDANTCNTLLFLGKKDPTIHTEQVQSRF